MSIRLIHSIYPHPGKEELVSLINLYAPKAKMQGVGFPEGIESYYPELAAIAAEAGFVGREVETIFEKKLITIARRAEGQIATYDIIKNVFLDHIQEQTASDGYVF